MATAIHEPAEAGTTNGYSVWRCPECRAELRSREEWEGHLESHPVCRATAGAVLELARFGVRVCTRCRAAMLGEVQWTVDGWVHAGCLTAQERAEIAAEGAEQLREILGANTDPRVTGTANGRESTRMKDTSGSALGLRRDKEVAV